MSIKMSNIDGGLKVKIGTFFGRELILITEQKMEIRTGFMGFGVAVRKYDNRLVRQFRYEEWTERGVRTCGIRFKYNGKTHVLVKALMGESDSLRTVVRIINVYKFSHWLAEGQQEQLSNSA
jgi:hypothetical protein